MKFLVEMWKKCKGFFLKRRMVRISVMLLLSGAICLCDNNLYCPQMPEIVFICTKYDAQYEPCKTVFIDKYGKCYCSNNKYVCESYISDFANIINAYKSGEIEDKIKLYGSCSRNEVIKRYRQMHKQAKKQIISR